MATLGKGRWVTEIGLGSSGIDSAKFNDLSVPLLQSISKDGQDDTAGQHARVESKPDSAHALKKRDLTLRREVRNP